MSNAFISEYRKIKQDESGAFVPVAVEPPLTTQQITFSTSAASSAFNESTRFIRVICDAKAHFKFDAAPTAIATDPYMPPDTEQHFGVSAGGKVAFYDGSS